MRFRFFIFLWMVISAFLIFEFYTLNHGGAHSLLLLLQKRHLIPESYSLSPEPGRPISLWLGYVGFSLMILTNLYIFRKRFTAMHGLGRLANWLDFHIFCGLAGPTFILFHCNFKVRGLVAISFWSMWVSVSSGVVGRYLLVQISKLKSDFQKEAERIQKRLVTFAENHHISNAKEILVPYQTRALVFAGAVPVPQNPFSALAVSLIGDIKMAFAAPSGPPVLGEAGKHMLAAYARNVRKANTVDSFNKLMGYWHTFHMPFAIFMYFAAVFHIIAALMLGMSSAV